MKSTRPDIASALAEAARDIDAPRSLDETLDAIVAAACVSVPGFEHVGVSVIDRDGAIETKAATGQLVWELDAAQYRLAEGPCWEAIRATQDKERSDPVVVSEHLRHEQRWPRYVPEATRAGVRAQMGLQLRVGDRPLGGLNLYATETDTVDPEAVRTAELFATHAALALGRARREDELAEALLTRKSIGMAIGLVMGRYRVDQERAFQFLVRASSTSNTKLRIIAEELVTTAELSYRNGRTDDGDITDDLEGHR